MNYEYIFVYGTLKRDTNSGMHHLLAKYAEFVDEATYCGKLYKVDDYPGAVPSNDPNAMVHGEVYLLHHADSVLPYLDQYEEYGPEFSQPNEYIRKKQEVFLRSGRGITVWVYIYNRSTEGLELIESADFLNLLS
ncbi:MAG: gamma-glutamylcyclotransferase family protein [Methylobacter sp.]